MKRVLITQCMVGIVAMQVCVVLAATDEEILETCNRENPSGTSLGWCQVIRTEADLDSLPLNYLPVQCEDNPDRQHLIVAC